MITYSNISISLYICIGPNVYSGREQIKGMCLVPKQSVNVMECEVNRLLLLSQNAIIPLSYVVQRKVYCDVLPIWVPYI